MTKRAYKKTGFTFIELIIAITIFSVIAVSVYSVLRVGVKLWCKTGPVIQANQSARFFFNTISSDLKNSVAYNKDKVNFEGGPQKISFMALVGASGQDILPHMELARVIYYYDRAKKAVVRAVAARAEGFDEDFARSSEILSDIETDDFKFEYCYKVASTATEYDYEWKNEWEDEDKDKGKIPRGIKVRAGEYSKIIFVPTGSLGGKDAQ